MEGDGRLDILLISDDVSVSKDIRSELLNTIHIRNYHIKLSKDLDEALGFLRGDEPKPDIIILDLGLIGVTSPEEIFQKIEGVDHNIPIIALTGKAEVEHNLAIFVMEAGASDVMIRGQFGGLADAIQFALIRSRIAKSASKKSTGELRTKNQVISWLSGGYSVESSEDAKGKDKK